MILHWAHSTTSKSPAGSPGLDSTRRFPRRGIGASPTAILHAQCWWVPFHAVCPAFHCTRAMQPWQWLGLTITDTCIIRTHMKSDFQQKIKCYTAEQGIYPPRDLAFLFYIHFKPPSCHSPNFPHTSRGFLHPKLQYRALLQRKLDEHPSSWLLLEITAESAQLFSMRTAVNPAAPWSELANGCLHSPTKAFTPCRFHFAYVCYKTDPICGWYYKHTSSPLEFKYAFILPQPFEKTFPQNINRTWTGNLKNNIPIPVKRISLQKSWHKSAVKVTETWRVTLPHARQSPWSELDTWKHGH